MRFGLTLLFEPTDFFGGKKIRKPCFPIQSSVEIGVARSTPFEGIGPSPTESRFAIVALLVPCPNRVPEAGVESLNEVAPCKGK